MRAAKAASSTRGTCGPLSLSVRGADRLAVLVVAVVALFCGLELGGVGATVTRLKFQGNEIILKGENGSADIPVANKIDEATELSIGKFVLTKSDENFAKAKKVLRQQFELFVEDGDVEETYQFNHFAKHIVELMNEAAAALPVVPGMDLRHLRRTVEEQGSCKCKLNIGMMGGMMGADDGFGMMGVYDGFDPPEVFILSLENGAGECKDRLETFFQNISKNADALGSVCVQKPNVGYTNADILAYPSLKFPLSQIKKLEHSSSSGFSEMAKLILHNWDKLEERSLTPRRFSGSEFYMRFVSEEFDTPVKSFLENAGAAYTTLLAMKSTTEWMRYTFDFVDTKVSVLIKIAERTPSDESVDDEIITPLNEIIAVVDKALEEGRVVILRVTLQNDFQIMLPLSTPPTKTPKGEEQHQLAKVIYEEVKKIITNSVFGETGRTEQNTVIFRDAFFLIDQLVDPPDDDETDASSLSGAAMKKVKKTKKSKNGGSRKHKKRRNRVVSTKKPRQQRNKKTHRSASSRQARRH